MWDKLFPNQLEKEKREQDKLIQEQLAQMQLQDELRLEKITQRGLINKELQRQEEEAKEEQQQRLEQDRLKEKETKKETDAAKKPPNGNEDPKKLSMLEMARLGYQELVNAIIRPPRAEYKVSFEKDWLSFEKDWLGNETMMIFQRVSLSLALLILVSSRFFLIF